MRQNQTNSLLCKKQYNKPKVKIVRLPEEDTIRTSGQMAWGDWGDWNPGRQDTFFSEGSIGGNQ